MSKPIIQIGDETREMTDTEHEQWLADNEAHMAAKQAAAAKEATRAAALAKLGLTADEIAALFG